MTLVAWRQHPIFHRKNFLDAKEGAGVSKGGDAFFPKERIPEVYKECRL